MEIQNSNSYTYIMSIVKPIAIPKSIDLNKHLILFIDQNDNYIKRAIPDFEERYIDAESSNINILKSAKKIGYFERVEYFDVNSQIPFFEIVLDPNHESRVVKARALNYSSLSLDDLFSENNQKMKLKRL